MSRYDTLLPDDTGIMSLSLPQLRNLATNLELVITLIPEGLARQLLCTVRALMDGRQYNIDRDWLTALHELIYGTQDLSQIRSDYLAFECALYFWPVSVAPLAIAAADQSAMSSGLGIVVFTDTSTGTISRWLWDFGDGSPSVYNYDQYIAHEYTIAGTYIASLTVTNPKGGSSQVFLPIQVASAIMVTEDGKVIVTEDGTTTITIE